MKSKNLKSAGLSIFRCCGLFYLCALIAIQVSWVAEASGQVILEGQSQDLTNSESRESVDLHLMNSDYILGSQLADAGDDVNDPLETFNRAVFAFNGVFYDAVMRPISNAYEILPFSIREIIGSFLSNLGAPVILVNDILQGEFSRATTTAQRFMINSTIGLGGMIDVASSAGLEEHDEDFGQTLAVWGIDEGFYLVLPILGPGNPRDAVGRFLIDPLIDPFNQYLDKSGDENWIYGRFALSALDQFAPVRDELEQVEKTSLDYYAAIRSLYRQKRKAEIANGDELDLPAIPDFEFSDFPGSESVEATVIQGNSDTNGIDYSFSMLLKGQRNVPNNNRYGLAAESTFDEMRKEEKTSFVFISPSPQKPINLSVGVAEYRDWHSEANMLIAEVSWDVVSYSSDDSVK